MNPPMTYLKLVILRSQLTVWRTLNRRDRKEVRLRDVKRHMGTSRLRRISGHAVVEIAEGIIVDPAVMVGKAVIKGTRMPVELVLAKLAANPDLDEFFLDYPELTLDQIRACLRFAALR
jgi:uncharacterized protein (DUF433 family)